MTTTQPHNESSGSTLGIEERLMSRMDGQLKESDQRMSRIEKKMAKYSHSLASLGVDFEGLTQRMSRVRHEQQKDSAALSKRLFRAEALLEYSIDGISKILETLQAQRGNVLQVPRINTGLQEQQKMSKTIQKALKATSIQVHNHERRIELLEAS